MRSRADNLIATLVFSFYLINNCHGGQNEDTDTYVTRLLADMWLEGADIVRIIWRDCSKKLMDVKDVIDHKEYFPKFVRCMKRKTLRALDKTLSPDVVPIGEGVNLVRFELVDRSGNIMPENYTSSWTDSELEEGDWRTLALQRMAKILRTHVVKFDFDQGKSIEKVEYRGRRRLQMMTMMMFGVVSIGMVMVPMGFQFLAVLGGKALLLAKMALILASVQGLRKVDNNNDGYHGYHDRGKIGANPLGYGFYHSYPPYDHYEKRSHDAWPQPAVMAATPPPSLSVQNPWTDIDTSLKADRIHIAQTKNENRESKRNAEVVTRKLEIPKSIKHESDARLYPIYAGEQNAQSDIFTAIDTPSPIIDFTTRPGEVQADYTLDLPFNRMTFQDSTSVVSI